MREGGRKVSHAQGGGREVLRHTAHLVGGEGEVVGGGVQLLLHQHVLLLLHGAPLLRPPVLEPDLYLKWNIIYNLDVYNFTKQELAKKYVKIRQFN